MSQNEKIKSFFENLGQVDSEKFMGVVEAHLSNDDIELICDHIEEFYGVEDDEEVGMLSQLVVTGFLLGKNETESIKF